MNKHIGNNSDPSLEKDDSRPSLARQSVRTLAAHCMRLARMVARRLAVLVNFRRVAPLLCLALFGCVPLGQETVKVVTRGEKNGARVENRLIQHKIYALVSPDGGGKTYINVNEYWLVDGKKEARLRFLDDGTIPESSPYMKEILGVADSDLWVAFRPVEQKAHFQVDLKIDVFDGAAIRYSTRVDNAIIAYISGQKNRDDYLSRIVDYSIQPHPGNAFIRINTKSGVVTYDVKNNILKQEESGSRNVPGNLAFNPDESAKRAEKKEPGTTPTDQDWDFEKIRQAAEQGDAKAQFQIGQMYSSGYRVSRNLSEAVVWYRKAAKQGDKDAEFVLKSLESMKNDARQPEVKGRGTTSSNSETTAGQEWNFEKTKQAAERGDAEAQFTLGLMYSNGIGIAQNFPKATKWYRKAAKQGHEGAEIAFKYLEGMKKQGEEGD